MATDAPKSFAVAGNPKSAIGIAGGGRRLLTSGYNVCGFALIHTLAQCQK